MPYKNLLLAIEGRIATAQAITLESKDKQEGTSAFLEKRKPELTGE